MILIFGLILSGLILIFFEVIVPGGILGFLGAGAIISACVISFQGYGVAGAAGAFLGSLVLAGLMLAFELKYLTKTKVGKRMFLQSSINEKSTQAQGEAGLDGKTGEVVTELAPTGTIVVWGKQYEGFSKDGLIKA